MIIYCLTNLINGKKYLGQTGFTLDYRIKYHLRQKRGNMIIGTALRKHGRVQFNEEILIHCEPDEANYYEEALISCLNTMAPNGYNMTIGGNGVRGHKLAKSTIEKIRIYRTGKKASEETKAKLSALAKNRSPEYRAKISANIKKRWADPNSKLRNPAPQGVPTP